MNVLQKVVRSLFSERIMPLKQPQIMGLKEFLPIKEKKEPIEYPERRRLRVIEKVPKYPSNLRPFKMQKRLRYMRGKEEIHNTLLHKQYGIIALGGGRLKHGHFEMMRLTLNRKLPEDRFLIYRVDNPWQPVTKKSQGMRMGSGKGSIDHYVTPVKAGRVIIELGGNCEFYEVKKLLTDVANKLPFKAMAVSQDMLDEMSEREQFLQEANLHPWTWKYIIQNNIWGCQKWLGYVDKVYFTKYL